MSFIILLLMLNQQLAREEKNDQLSEMVGKNFLDQIANRDSGRAAKLCAPTVNFDGEEIKGDQAVQLRLKKMIADHPAEIAFKRFFFFSGVEAQLKFGALPQRLKNIDLQKSYVLLAKRRKGGIAVILQQVTDGTGSWPRVVALTD